MPLFFADIKREICAEFGITKEEFESPSRKVKITKARQKAWYRGRKELGLAYGLMGRHSGGKDHCTVLYGAQKYAYDIGEMETVTPHVYRRVPTIRRKVACGRKSSDGSSSSSTSECSAGLPG